MKKMAHLLFVAFSIGIASCDNTEVHYSGSKKFGEDYYWYKSDKPVFEVDIKQNSHPVELVLHLRYASSYLYDKALLKITETDPTGEKIRRDVDIAIRDAKGEFIGDKGFDIIDLEYVLDASKQYPQFGKYSYEIEQDMPDVDPLEFVMEIGLKVRDVPKK
jgi:gliding motility-associated lipoprotein GldH